jgi:hypothetical protein
MENMESGVLPTPACLPVVVDILTTTCLSEYHLLSINTASAWIAVDVPIQSVVIAPLHVRFLGLLGVHSYAAVQIQHGHRIPLKHSIVGVVYLDTRSTRSNTGSLLPF